jgi:hypothetical protein
MVRKTRKRGGGYGVSERYFGVHTSLGTSEVPSSMSTASYIRPPLMETLKGGRRQRGGGDSGYTGNERYFGVDTQVSAGPPPLSSAATNQFIRPPMMIQRGGFYPSVMGSFTNTASTFLPLAIGAAAYKTYRSYKGSRKARKSKKRSRR